MRVCNRPAFPVDPARCDIEYTGLTIREFAALQLWAARELTVSECFDCADLFCDELERQRAKGASDA